jgi:hypothetical protein
MDPYVAAVLETVPWGRSAPPSDPATAAGDVVAALRDLGVQFAAEPHPDGDLTDDEEDTLARWLADASGHPRFSPAGRGHHVLLSSEGDLTMATRLALDRHQGDPEMVAQTLAAKRYLLAHLRPRPS